jgi:hypothetical protein
MYNARVDPTNPRRLIRLSASPAYLAFVFGPQHIADSAIDSSTASLPARMETQIAGPSRVVVPFVGDVIELSTASLLSLLRAQEMTLPAAAAPGVLPTAAPTVRQTALELPYKMLLSPAPGARWSHRVSRPVAGGPVELWRTRLATTHPTIQGALLEGPSPQRTLRAVWARGSTLLQSPGCSDTAPNDNSLIYPGSSPPAWSTSLSNHQRALIVGASTGSGAPIAVQDLVLSTLGATFDIQGNWASAPFCDLIAWKHAAAQGRDVKVEVVTTGYLLPFGHRAALVTLSERKLRDSKAPLLKRQFLVFPERRVDLRPGPVGSPTGTDTAVKAARQLPFSEVTIDVSSSPDLAIPADPGANHGVFPLLLSGSSSEVYLVPMTGVDHAGRRVRFRVPMAFAYNAVPGDAAPSQLTAAIQCANILLAALPSDLEGQRVAMAPPSALTESVPNDDTTVEVRSLSWQVVAQNASLIQIPLGPLPTDFRASFAPKVSSASVVIEAARQLTGKADPVNVSYFEGYAANGFPGSDPSHPNVNAVFLRMEQLTDNLGNPADRVLTAMSDQGIPGGLLSPNMALQGLSRSIGLVAGTVSNLSATAGTAAGVLSNIASGTGNVSPSSFLDTMLDSALTGSKIFGVFSLKSILPTDAVNGVKDAASHLPSFVTRGLDSVQNIIHMAEQAWTIFNQAGDRINQAISDAQAAAKAAATQFTDDALVKAQGVLAAIAKVVQAAFATIKATIEVLLRKAKELISGVAANLDSLTAAQPTLSLSDIGKYLENALGAFLNALGNAGSGGLTISVPCPSFNNPPPVDVLQGKVDSLVGFTTQTITIPIPAGKTLDSVIGEAKSLADTVRRTVEQVIDRVRQFQKMIEGEIGGISAFVQTYVVKALDLYAKGQKLIEDQVLSIEWKTPLVGVNLGGMTKFQDQALFWPGKGSQLALVGEARAKAKGGKQAGVEITASLDAFDIQLLAPSTFLILKFKKLALVISTRKKPEIDVVFDKFVFAGPLSFFNTLKEMIPLDGFSDPPAVQISPSGIIADFSLALPDIAVGMFSLANLAISAGCTIPFMGSALTVRFAFCSAANPFLLTVCALGGSGYFAIEVSPGGVEKLELSLAAAAALSLDFGVASGTIAVTAGFYLKLEGDDCTLTGFLKLRGAVSVLGGLFSASLEMYLSLTYESHTCPNGQEAGLLRGRATLEVSVSLLFFSASAHIECERTFAGSNGDPTFEQVMCPLNQQLPDPTLTAPQWPWREYVDAFDAAA